ncbi:MAG: hypothetical protein QXY50_04070 [Candidatus Caldarchaeum sp.]
MEKPAEEKDVDGCYGYEDGLDSASKLGRGSPVATARGRAVDAMAGWGRKTGASHLFPNPVLRFLTPAAPLLM